MRYRGPIAAVAAALAAGGAAAATAPPVDTRAEAERLVRKALGAKLPTHRRVRCGRRVRGGFACRFRAERELSPNRTRRCRGRYVVRRRARRTRVRCKLRVAPRDPQFGFNDISVGLRQATIEQSANLNESLGTGLYRKTIDWRHLEPEQGRYDWERYDKLYAELLARGIRPVWVLGFAPPWAWDFLTFCQGTECFFPPARDHLESWRRLAAEVARRYPRSAAVEVWNEPNERNFWQSGPDPARYAELLAEAHRSIKAVAPRMPVLAGGFSDRVIRRGPNIPLLEFIESIHAHGAGGHYDGLSFHLYPRHYGVSYITDTLAAVRLLQDRVSASGRPLWITEFGLTTTGDFGVSETEQAERLIAFYRALRGEKDVRAHIVHTLVEPPGSRLTALPGYGIVRSDMTRKPAYCAFIRELRIGTACPY